jgi:general secretion pathway protein B
MSYILDALRRADAERERGTVPSLHTQQFGGLPGDDEAPPKPRLLIGAVVVLFLALGGVLAWLFLGGSEPPPRPVVQAVTPARAPMPPPASTIATAPTVTPPVMPPAAASSIVPAPAPVAAAKPTARPLPRPPAAKREATPASATATASPAEDRIYSLSELPESVRRELPKISYGGGSYSPDKASRLAFLNGQVFHEGATIAPGLVLKQVKQKGVILAYKGYRFEIGP